MVKYIPIETELKLPHYLEQDKWVGKKVRIRKHLFKDTILRRSTTAIIKEIIFNPDGTCFAINVEYADGTVWNECIEEFKLKLVSLIQ